MEPSLVLRRTDLIKADSIHKFYGNLHVLKGVSVEIKPAEVISIIGKSGAGKTTLLHILGTLDRPDSGYVTFGNISTDHMNDRQLSAFRNAQIGFVFQFHHLLNEFTALENVCIPAYIRGTDRQIVTKKASELLQYLGLQNRLTHKPNELSGGEQQRVAIARALINNPTVVLADEPTGNLDSSTSEEIHELIFQLRKDLSQTFVIVTHNRDLAARCDRTLEMEDGRIVI